jgi:hypothetical protein
MNDIFADAAFDMTSLTDAVNAIQFVPGRIGQLGVFEASTVSTTTIAIERQGDILELIPPTPRGGPGTTLDKAKRDLRQFALPHFEINDAIFADEVQNVRAFGSEGALQSAMAKVAERMRTHVNSLSATEEYARMGALKGIVTYADGSTFNLFDEFGVTQESEIDFDLHTDGSATGAFRKKCAASTRLIANQLGGVPFIGIHAFCGDAFYDQLIGNAEVRQTYQNHAGAAELRSGYAAGGMSFGSFPFGGIMWENYRGKVGSTDFVHTDKCHIFPVGVPGLFCSVFGPADYFDTVNMPGRRLFARQFEMSSGKGRRLDTQTNALHYCVRPKVLLLGKHT